MFPARFKKKRKCVPISSGGGSAALNPPGVFAPLTCWAEKTGLRKRETKLAPTPLRSPLNTATTIQQPHILTREKTVVVFGWCCVWARSISFFLTLFSCFLFFKKKKNQISSSSSSTYFACRAKHEWLWREKENSYTWNHWQEEGKQRPTLFLRLYRHALSSSGLKRHHHHWQ